MDRKQQIKHLRNLLRYCIKAGFYSSKMALEMAIEDAVAAEKVCQSTSTENKESKGVSPFKGELPECSICCNCDSNKYGRYCMIAGSLQICKKSGMCVDFSPEIISSVGTTVSSS